MQTPGTHSECSGQDRCATGKTKDERDEDQKVRCWFVTQKGMSRFTRHHLPPDSENLLSAVKRLTQGQLYSQHVSHKCQ